jgi:pyochelin biosynthesis protein PchC
MCGTFDNWFRRFPEPGRPGSGGMEPAHPGARHAGAGLRLVCFPHAGGTASFFRSWSRELPPCVELLAVQYPGRQDRLREPAAADVHELADTVAAALLPALDQPLALFGHSLGATIAYEVATRVEQRAGGMLAHLIVSAKPAPARQRHSAKHLLGDDVLWAEACRLGGVPDELVDSRAVRDLVLPSLRADYRLDETYQPRDRPPLRCPVLACAGGGDPEATPDEVTSWRAVTGGGCTMLTFPGGHFYMLSGLADFIAELVRQIGRLHTAPRGLRQARLEPGIGLGMLGGGVAEQLVPEERGPGRAGRALTAADEPGHDLEVQQAPGADGAQEGPQRPGGGTFLMPALAVMMRRPVDLGKRLGEQS